MKQLNDLPMIDLHRHLDGSIRPSTILEIAKNQNSTFSKYNLEQLERLIYIDHQTSDLLAFLQRLDYGVSVLATYEDCFRVAYESVEDAYNEGIDYIELRFSPFYMARTHNLNLNAVVDAVLDGAEAATEDFSIKINMIGILSRTFGRDACFAELDAILHAKNRFVAVDLAGDEVGFPPELFIEHFDKVKRAGLQATVHAGESGTAEYIWTALNSLHAKRIGHGVKAIDDPKLLDFIFQNNIGIESCVTSNFQTATWTEIETHPLKTFLEADIQACICTDDPGVSNITLGSEYKVAKQQVVLSENQLQQAKKNAFMQSFGR